MNFNIRVDYSLPSGVIVLVDEDRVLIRYALGATAEEVAAALRVAEVPGIEVTTHDEAGRG